ncbi:MAG: drug/metabolite exporter YedA [Gemmatimonadaceae bacterium]
MTTFPTAAFAAPAPARSEPTRAKVIAAFLAIYLIWGSTYLAIRFAVETLPPFLMVGVRFLVAGTLLYAWSRLRGARAPTLIQWRSAAIIGGLLLMVGNGGVVWAEQRLPSGLTALLVVVPFWMVVLEWVRPRGRRPSGAVLAGLALGLAGLALLVGPDAFHGVGTVDPVGAVVVVFASLAWAGGSLYSRSAPLPASPLLTTGMEMLAGGALLTIGAIALGEPRTLHPALVSARSLGALLYLITFGSLLGFTAYVWLLKVAAPAKVATYAYVNPVVAVYLGWALAGEAVSPRTGIAAAIIIAAVALITLERKPAVVP